MFKFQPYDSRDKRYDVPCVSDCTSAALDMSACESDASCAHPTVNAIWLIARYFNVIMSQEFVYYVARVFIKETAPTKHADLSIRDVCKAIKKYGCGDPALDSGSMENMPARGSFCKELPAFDYGYLVDFDEARSVVAKGIPVIFGMGGYGEKMVDSPAVLIGFNNAECTAIVGDNIVSFSYDYMFAHANDFWVLNFSGKADNL